MAKDQVGNTLKRGDKVIVTLQNPFVFAVVEKLEETEILGSDSRITKQPKVHLSFIVALNGPLNVALGVFKAATSEVSSAKV